MTATTRFDPVPGLGLSPRLLTLGGIGLLVLPQLLVIATSLDPSDTAIFPPDGVSLRWYWNALERPAFREALVLSLLLAALSALLATAFGTMAALLVVRHRFPGRRLLITTLQLPMMIPEVMLGLGFLIFFTNAGMRVSWLNIALAHVVITLPYATRVIMANLQTVGRSVEEAAHVLGAGPILTFFRITAPIIRQGMLAAAIFAFIVSFDNFTVTAFLATSRGTLPIEIYAYIRTESDPTIAAISSLLIFASVLAIVVLERVLGVEKLSQAGRTGG